MDEKVQHVPTLQKHVSEQDQRSDRTTRNNLAWYIDT